MTAKKDVEYDIASLNFHEREVFLYSEIDENLAYKVCSRLRALDKLDNKKPIKLYINTPGGCCSDGLAIIDTINDIKSPVHTIIIGEACSMGSFISITGYKRYATKNSLWMAHDITLGMDDYLQKVKDRMKFEEKYEKMLDNIYRKYTKLSDDEINKAKNGELWLFANDMLKKGIIDQII